MADKALGNDVRAVFFDAVGTVIHPEPSAAKVYEQIGKRHGSKLPFDQIRSRFAGAFHHEEVHDQKAGLRTSEARELERWRRIVGTVLDDVRDPEQCFAELFEHFSRPEAWRVEPDVAETFQTLQARALTVGLASNYDHRLRTVAQGFPEFASLTHLVISSEVGWRKPAPGFFEAVCRAVSLPPEQILFVGDDPGNDYEGARSAGLASVLFDPNLKHAEKGTIRIRRLTEVLDM